MDVLNSVVVENKERIERKQRERKKLSSDKERKDSSAVRGNCPGRPILEYAVILVPDHSVDQVEIYRTPHFDPVFHSISF